MTATLASSLPAALPTADPGVSGAYWSNGLTVCVSAAGTALPTTDPGIAGALWVDGNVVAVSAAAGSGLPTTDPGIAGAYWSDGGVLCISAAVASVTTGAPPPAPVAPLASAELVACRRYLGYPAYGAGASGFQSWRFFEWYGMLEYRLANISSDEINVVRNTYLANLPTLETAILSAGANLDTDQAAVWKHNTREVADRTALYRQWRLEFAAFLGVPPGPALQARSGERIV